MFDQHVILWFQSTRERKRPFHDTRNRPFSWHTTTDQTRIAIPDTENSRRFAPDLNITIIVVYTIYSPVKFYMSTWIVVLWKCYLSLIESLDYDIIIIIHPHCNNYNIHQSEITILMNIIQVLEWIRKYPNHDLGTGGKLGNPDHLGVPQFRISWSRFRGAGANLV